MGAESAIAARLAELELLVLNRSSGDGIGGLASLRRTLRFSTLLLAFRGLTLKLQLGKFDADLGLATAEISLLLSQSPIPSSLRARSWMHQSPDKQRSTRRLVVGLISRILELPIKDSKV